MSDAVRNHFDYQTLGIADGLVARRAVAHHTGKLDCFGNPAAVFFMIQFDGELHFFHRIVQGNQEHRIGNGCGASCWCDQDLIRYPNRREVKKTLQSNPFQALLGVHDVGKNRIDAT